MGEYRQECCEPPRPECCCRPCCEESGNGLGLLLILVLLYFLFCGNSEKGGLFGGLF